MIEIAVVSYVLGTVQVGKPEALLPAKLGESVSVGEQIKTGEGSLAILTFKDQSHVKLNANSQLTLEAGKDPQDEVLLLKSGGVFSEVAKKARPHFYVRTHAVTMGVRGTRFFTAYGKQGKSGEDVWMCVQEGEVAVESSRGKSPVLVHEGEGVFVPAGKDVTPPKPYEWTKGLNWNMDPDKGDVVDHTSMKSVYKDLTRQNYD